MHPERLNQMDQYLEEVDAKVRTSRRASEIFFNMPSLSDAVRGEMLIRDDLNTVYNDFLSGSYASVTINARFDAARADYWEKAQNVSEIAGAYASATLGDYFKVDLDRNEASIREQVHANYELGSVPHLMLNAVEAYATALDSTIMESARIATKHLMSVLPYMKRDAALLIAKDGATKLEATSSVFRMFSDRLVPSHIEKSLTLGGIAPHSIIPQDAQMTAGELPALVVSSHDATGLTKVYKLERRPYSTEELILANHLAQEPLLQVLLISFQQKVVEYSTEYLDAHPERKAHSLLPFSEFFVDSEHGFIPNPKLLKVLCNNYLPALASVMLAEGKKLSNITGEDLSRAAIDAQKRRVFFAQIAKFNNYDQTTDTVELDAFIGRTCPGMKVLTSGLTVWLPQIYDQLQAS